MILKAYKTKFKATSLPSEDEITPEQCKWCLGFIKSLAGKAGAYAHVGGKAQDLGVRALDVDTKGKLITALGKAGLKVLTEQVNGSKSKIQCRGELRQRAPRLYRLTRTLRLLRRTGARARPAVLLPALSRRPLSPRAGDARSIPQARRIAWHRSPKPANAGPARQRAHRPKAARAAARRAK